MDTQILADPMRRAVNKADTRAFAQQYFLDEKFTFYGGLTNPLLTKRNKVNGLFCFVFIE
jgi:hypothetical protein